MSKFENCAKEIFNILSSYKLDIVLYDEDGNRTYEPKDARRFYVSKKNLLVSIIDDNVNSSVKLYLGAGANISNYMELIQSLRSNAVKFNFIFNVGKYGKRILPKDFAHITEGRNTTMNLFEGMKGTKSNSYLVLENSKLIINHSKKTYNLLERAKSVKSIIIEDNGNQYNFPSTNIIAARAMTQHLNHGGEISDFVGSKIMKMAEDFAALSTCVSNSRNMSNEIKVIHETCNKEMISIIKNLYEIWNKVGYKKLNESYKKNVDSCPVKVTEAHIKEMGAILNTKNKTLPDHVLAVVCEAIIKEAYRVNPLLEKSFDDDRMKHDDVTILGKRVNREVWDELHSQDKIDFTTTPMLPTEMPRFATKTAELAYKLSVISSFVRNSSLGNLLSYLSEKMPEERSGDVLKKMRQIALKAMNAADFHLDSGIPSNNVIREYFEWFNSKSIKIIENDSQYVESPDVVAELDKLDMNFPTENFYKRGHCDAYFEYVDNGEVDENTITTNEIRHAIFAYFKNGLNKFNIVASTYTRLIDELVKKHLPSVIRSLEDTGFVVLDKEDILTENLKLDREDILLPSDNMHDVFRDQVIAKTVSNPIDGHTEFPGPDYIEQMRALSGLTSAEEFSNTPN